MLISKKVPAKMKENTDPADPFLNEINNEYKKLTRTKLPGKFTSKRNKTAVGTTTITVHISTNQQADGPQVQQDCPAPIVEDIEKLIINLDYNQESANHDLIESLQEALRNAITKNETLLAMNSKLKSQNRDLISKLQQLEFEIQVLREKGGSNSETIMSFFNPERQVPVIQPYVDSNNYFVEYGIQDPPSAGSNSDCNSRNKARMVKCSLDSNSNLRAFYLALIKTPEGRSGLRSLLEQLQMDDDYKLIPLLPTNQVWVMICKNYLENIESGLCMTLDQIIEYINSTRFVDLALISALRSRASFKTQQLYDSEIQTPSVYRILANYFNMAYKQITQVAFTTYRFQSGDQVFEVFHTYENEYLIRFDEILQQASGAQSQVQSEYRINFGINPNRENQADQQQANQAIDDPDQPTVVNEFDLEEDVDQASRVRSQFQGGEGFGASQMVVRGGSAQCSSMSRNFGQRLFTDEG